MSRDSEKTHDTPVSPSEGRVTNEGRAEASDKPVRDVPVAWEALEDAFENNAPEVHS